MNYTHPAPVRRHNNKGRWRGWQIWSAVILGIALLVGIIANAMPARADMNGTAWFTNGSWTLADWDPEPGAPELSVATCGVSPLGNLKLTKPSGAVGVSYETNNLGLQVHAGQYLAALVKLDNADQAAAGAVRFFAYGHADANTATEGPDLGVKIIPGGADGTNEYDMDPFAGDATIGTFGFTYDASNSTTGTVEFASLYLMTPHDGAVTEALSISLCPMPVVQTTDPATEEPTTPAPTTPSETETQEPTTEPTTQAPTTEPATEDPTEEPTTAPTEETTEPTPTTSDSPVPSDSTSSSTVLLPGPSLPKTGSSLGGLLFAGIAMLLAGAGVLVWLYWQRRNEARLAN